MQTCVCVEEREEGQGDREKDNLMCMDILSIHPCVSKNWNNIHKT